MSVAEEYLKKDQPPYDLSKVPNTKAVRNFLCDNLFNDDLLISHAPANEFGSSRSYQWLTGTYICDYNKAGNTIDPRERIHFRTVKALFDAGVLRVNRNIRSPHLKCVVFEWNAGIKRKRRELLVYRAFGEVGAATQERVSTIAAMYGLQVHLNINRGLFEILLGEKGEPLHLGKAQRSYLFENAAGQPMTGWRDMSFAEWEETLHRYATESGAINNPLPVPEGHKSHLSKHRLN